MLLSQSDAWEFFVVLLYMFTTFAAWRRMAAHGESLMKSSWTVGDLRALDRVSPTRDHPCGKTRVFSHSRVAPDAGGMFNGMSPAKFVSSESLA